MTIDQLIADIRATFPKLAIQQRTQYTTTLTGALAWMIGGDHEAVMPDGMQILVDASDDDHYSFGVHAAFDAWLANRGWYLERYDEFWFWPTKLPTPEEIAEWRAAWAAAAAKQPKVAYDDGGIPF
jgi:hypothetical protein